MSSNIILESLYKILSHPTRRKILHYLYERESATFTELMGVTGIKISAKLSWHLKSLRRLVKRVNDKYILTEIGRSIVEKDKELFNLLKKSYPEEDLYLKTRFEVPLNPILVLSIAIGGRILINTILSLNKHLVEHPIPIFMSVGILCGILYSYLGAKHLHIELDELFWGSLVIGVLLSGAYFYFIFLQACLVIFFSFVVSRIVTLNEIEDRTFRIKKNHLKVFLILLVISSLLGIVLSQTIKFIQYSYSHFNGYYLLVISESYIDILTDFSRESGIISASGIRIDVTSIVLLFSVGYVIGLLLCFFKPKILSHRTIIGIAAILFTFMAFLSTVTIPLGSLREIVIPLLFIIWPLLIGIWLQTVVIETKS